MIIFSSCQTTTPPKNLCKQKSYCFFPSKESNNTSTKLLVNLIKILYEKYKNYKTLKSTYNTKFKKLRELKICVICISVTTFNLLEKQIRLGVWRKWENLCTKIRIKSWYIKNILYVRKEDQDVHRHTYTFRQKTYRFSEDTNEVI
jgi:hypothetical protein